MLRTIIVNAITASVAVGLIRNRLLNTEIVPSAWGEEGDAPKVHIIVPLRNEEANTDPLLRTLLNQRYPEGRWSVTAVDDCSTDATYQIAESMARSAGNLTVIKAGPLPTGWTGKNHAIFSGANSERDDSDWLLFVDADTRHHPEMLSSVVQRARITGADMLSLILNVRMLSFWERVIVPQVGELYTLLVGTMDSVNTSEGGAAANGQFILIRRSLYAQAGSLPEVVSDVAEDRALAAACKRLGANVRLEYGRKLVEARVYSSLREMWAGYSKTLFWASGHNTARAIVVALALALYAMLPPCALVWALWTGRDRDAALRNAPLQIIPMLALRAVVCRDMGIPLYYALTYPLGVAVGDTLLLFSLYRVISGKGVMWKGRTYK